jgi:osmotically-inducible protein OsmY
MGAELAVGATPTTNIADAVIYALKSNPRVPFDRLTVVVREGVATLSGHVNWKYESLAAATTAAAVTGVKYVDNQIVVDIA